MDNKYCVFILTNGRPDKVYTYTSLRNQGYTGDIVVVVDNEDPTLNDYIQKFGEKVYVFDKKKESHTTDECDNFGHRKAIVYARNASFRIAKEKGYKYFFQFDDDYRRWDFRQGRNKQYHGRKIKNLDAVFAALLNFYIISGADAIAIAQNGDFMGGGQNTICSPQWILKRKCMNTWLCDIDKPLQFSGHMNEDCSQYVVNGLRGKLFLQVPFCSVQQAVTQKLKGGMTELYRDSGTYLKTFYTVMQAPSCTKIKLLGYTNMRIHHNIQFKNCTPQIIGAQWKK